MAAVEKPSFHVVMSSLSGMLTSPLVSFSAIFLFVVSDVLILGRCSARSSR